MARIITDAESREWYRLHTVEGWSKSKIAEEMDAAWKTVDKYIEIQRRMEAEKASTTELIDYGIERTRDAIEADEGFDSRMYNVMAKFIELRMKNEDRRVDVTPEVVSNLQRLDDEPKP